MAERKVKILESDIKILEAASNQKIKEMELVHWYISVMEQGVDATKAMKDFALMKKKKETIEQQRLEEKSKYEREIKILQFKLKETQDQLKK